MKINRMCKKNIEKCGLSSKNCRVRCTRRHKCLFKDRLGSELTFNRRKNMTASPLGIHE